VAAEDVQLALTIFADAVHDGALDMAVAIEDDELWKRNQERIAPDVAVRFVTPPGDGRVLVLVRTLARLRESTTEVGAYRHPIAEGAQHRDLDLGRRAAAAAGQPDHGEDSAFAGKAEARQSVGVTR
jgi:hypothetical protein